jgi:hypothetical protein
MQRHHTDVIGLRAAESSCTVALFVPIERSHFSVQTESFSGLPFLRRPRYESPRMLPFFSCYDQRQTHPLGSSPQNLGQSDLEIVIRGDTESVQAYDSLDPTYVAKTNLTMLYVKLGWASIRCGLLTMDLGLRALFN